MNQPQTMDFEAMTDRLESLLMDLQSKRVVNEKAPVARQRSGAVSQPNHSPDRESKKEKGLNDNPV